MFISVPAGLYRAEGWIRNYNTFEEYKNADRTRIIEQIAGRTVSFVAELLQARFLSFIDMGCNK